MAKDKKWIQKAVKHPGSFTKWCGGKVTEECIERGLRSNNPTIRRRAALARTFRKMAAKRKKGALGLEDIVNTVKGWGEDIGTAVDTLDELLQNTQNEKTNNVIGFSELMSLISAANTGMLMGDLANTMNNNAQYLRSTIDNIYNIYGLGGDVNDVPVEIEGGEVVETPQGVKKVKGPSHGAGGINVDLPEGSTVYSKRIEINGKTMAQRKLERERREDFYRKRVDKTADPIAISTLNRVKEVNNMQESADKAFQNMMKQLLEQVNMQQQNVEASNPNFPDDSRQAPPDRNDVYKDKESKPKREKFATGGDVTGDDKSQDVFTSAGVDINKVIDALISVESSGNHKAVSEAGARGYAQFLPSTWEDVWKSNDPEIQAYIKEHGKPDIHTKDVNAHKIAAKVYLEQLTNRYINKGLDPGTAFFTALTAYNMGPAKLDREVSEKYKGDYKKAIADWKHNNITFMSYSRKVLNKAGYDDSKIFGGIVKGFQYTGKTTPKGNPEITIASTDTQETETSTQTQTQEQQTAPTEQPEQVQDNTQVATSEQEKTQEVQQQQPEQTKEEQPTQEQQQTQETTVMGPTLFNEGENEMAATLTSGTVGPENMSLTETQQQAGGTQTQASGQQTGTSQTQQQQTASGEPTIHNILNAATYTTNQGTALGIEGMAISSFGPLFATLQAEKNNRPFENYFKDYGQQLIQNAMNMYSAARSSTNVAENEIARAQYLANLQANQNIANSAVRGAVNTANAANAMANYGRAEANYMNMVNQINQNVSRIMDQVERTRLAGAQQADMWNRKQQDNTWTQLVRNITNLGFGLQNMARQVNLQGYNEYVSKKVMPYFIITPQKTSNQKD